MNRRGSERPRQKQRTNRAEADFRDPPEQALTLHNPNGGAQSVQM